MNAVRGAGEWNARNRKSLLGTADKCARADELGRLADTGMEIY